MSWLLQKTSFLGRKTGFWTSILFLVSLFVGNPFRTAGFYKVAGGKGRKLRSWGYPELVVFSSKLVKVLSNKPSQVFRVFASGGFKFLP